MIRRRIYKTWLRSRSWHWSKSASRSGMALLLPWSRSWSSDSSTCSWSSWRIGL